MARTKTYRLRKEEAILTYYNDRKCGTSKQIQTFIKSLPTKHGRNRRITPSTFEIGQILKDLQFVQDEKKQWWPPGTAIEAPGTAIEA